MYVNIGRYTENGRMNGGKHIKIHVSDSDVWSADETLAPIIEAVLKKYKECNINSYPMDFYTTDNVELGYKAWHKVVDEMIWAFSHCSGQCNCGNNFDIHTQWEEYKQFMLEHNEHVKVGLNLFSIHFNSLWD